ncbi:Lysozyme RrrD [compost metagenome]
MSAKTKLIAKIGAVAAASAVSLVAYFEGYVPRVYVDPVGRLAACYGHDDQTLKLGTTYTRAQCETMLADDLAKHAEALNCIKTPMTDGQKAAFVSFAYNVGVQGFCGSTLVRKANAGDMAGACAELSRWVMAGGKKLPGLVSRRAAERELCEKP